MADVHRYPKYCLDYYKKLQLLAVTLLLVSTLFLPIKGHANSNRPSINTNGMVRLVYFLPNDRPARPDRMAALRQLIKDAQQFYADEMHRHGFGGKTFTVETDANGVPVVHQVDGQFTNNYYYTGTTDFKVWDELLEHFTAPDALQHVYFIAIDLSYEALNDGQSGGLGGVTGQTRLRHRYLTAGDEIFGGFALIPAFGRNFERLGLTVHELGHAFALAHDFRQGRHSDYVMSFGNATRLSKCAAEWLSVSRFFNTKSTFHNEPGEIRFLSLQTYNQDVINLRFKVTDPDGLHQAQLLVPEILNDTGWGPFQLFDCKRLNRKTGFVESVVRTAELVDRITLQIIDVGGNITWATFPIELDALAPAKNALDINSDGIVNLSDLVSIASRFGQRGKDTADVNGDGVVDIVDVLLVAAHIPDLSQQAVEMFTETDVQKWLTHAKQLEVENEILQKGIVLLEHLLAVLTAVVVDITDVNLRAKIEEQLGKASGATITTAEMADDRFTNLEAPNANISDLTGLKYATNLTTLILWDNNISDISVVTHLTDLTELSLGGNSVTDISPIEGLTNLRLLHLPSNPVTDISPVEELVNLTYLNLSNVNISDISPLKKLTQLTELYLAWNNITDISLLKDLINLDFLDLRGNNISDILPLVTNMGLGSGDTVYLNDNPLSSVSIETHIPDLQDPERGVLVEFDGAATGEGVNIPDQNLRAKIEEELGKASGATITTAEMANFPLPILIAQESDISDLTGLEHATNLLALWLSGNNISDISRLSGLTSLIGLILDSNNITDISRLSGLTSLTVLTLGNNNITDISSLADLTSLTGLILDSNNITDISSLAGLTNLTQLTLGNNNITDISSLAGLTNLGGLNGGVNIGYVGPGLYLQNNSISDIAPLVTNMGLGSGDELDIRGNPLSYPSIHRHIPDLQDRGVTVEFDNRTPAIPLKISGDNQEGTPSTILDQSFALDVQDQNGKAFAGVPVVFTVTEGGGVLSITSTVTDANGRAESTLTLGPNPGTNTVEVSVEGISQPVVFSAEAALPPPVPTTLSIVSGDNQSGLTGEVLANPFAVKVRDQYDAPMEGVTVTLAVSAGGGTPSPEMTTTDANGQAESTLTLGPNPGTNTVEVSVEGITEMVTFNAIAKLLDFDLSVPADISLIHVPLKVTAVAGVSKTLTSVADLYDALGGATAVNSLITYDYTTQRWHSYSSDRRRGTPDDQVLTDDRGIIAVMKQPVTIRLGGKPLGTNRSSTITLHQGINLVGVPLKDSKLTRVSDLLMLDGIRGNVSAITVSDGGAFKVVTTSGQPGAIPITGGQSFIMRARQAATVTISGQGWANVSGTAAAAPLALRGIEVGDTTPVLGVSGSIADEESGLQVDGFRVTVKNLSTGRAVTVVKMPDEVGYQLTVVDIETGRAATIGDTLEISAQSPDPFIGVQPMQYTVTTEDVKQSWIQLPALVAYEIPAETELLTNYPNPFNPETWIPYRLAEDAFVTLTIYDGAGQVVRALAVGHRVAAFYESRSKAIYWDGRNDVGEGVASGVYFYTLTAGDFSATRRMVILK